MLWGRHNAPTAASDVSLGKFECAITRRVYSNHNVVVRRVHLTVQHSLRTDVAPCVGSEIVLFTDLLFYRSVRQRAGLLLRGGFMNHKWTEIEGESHRSEWTEIEEGSHSSESGLKSKRKVATHYRSEPSESRSEPSECLDFATICAVRVSCTVRVSWFLTDRSIWITHALTNNRDIWLAFATTCVVRVSSSSAGQPLNLDYSRTNEQSTYLACFLLCILKVWKSDILCREWTKIEEGNQRSYLY